VPASSEVAVADLVAEVGARMREHDLLVLGAPLPGPGGELEWGQATRELLDAEGDYPILVVRAATPAAEEGSA